jgi:pimeloyl-ACP methyl ester carboxylesterase
MFKGPSFGVLLGLATALLLLAGHGASSEEITDERWQDADCPFEVGKDFTVGEDVICGKVTVPLRHSEPDGQTITLSVAVFTAFGDSPAPDPLVMFTGGPGGNIFDLAPRKRSVAAALTGTARDTVFMSERGTFGSEPMLDCPELAVIDENFGVWGKERDALELEAYTQCRDRLVAEGVDLAAFNNAERAADVPYVMDILGFDAFNVWGVSGGGVLVELVARDHSESGIRTIMTDSGSFPRADWRDIFTPLFTNMSARIRLLFERCASDPECNADFPDLEQVFFDLIADLNRNPARVPIKRPATGEKVEIDLTGDLFVAVLVNSFALIDAVPKMISDASEGDFDLLSLFLPEAFMGDTGISTADGLYLSMICPEIGEMSMEDVSTDGAYTEIVRILSPKVQSFFDRCSIWDVPPVPPGDLVVSAIPALIMEGAFDTNKSPDYGAEVAANFHPGHLVVFGDKAHVVFGECALKMMAEFMDDPATRPDTSCVADRPDFSGPAGPMWWIVYNNLVLVIAGVVILLVVVIGGIVWFVRRRRAGSRSRLEG